MIDLASGYPLGGVLYTVTMVAIGVIWLYVVVKAFVDIFSRWDMSGWGKAAWTIAILVLPLVGALAYLISQSKSMAERAKADVSPGGVNFDENELDMPARTRY